MSIFDKELPSIYRNQLNGKTAQENYNEYIKERQKEFYQSLLDSENQKELEKIIEQSLSDILKSLNLSR